MSRILLFLLLSCNFAVAQISQQTIVNEITANLPTNNQNLISAELLRNTLNQMTSAIFQNQGLSGFTITNTPVAGQIIIATSPTVASWQNSNSSTNFTQQSLIVTSTNILANLNTSANGNIFLLIVNGQTIVPVGNLPPFSVSGTVVTWNAANAGYSLETTDSVVAIYSH